MQTRDYRYRHAWDARLNLPLGSVERVVHGAESWRSAQRGQISEAEYWRDVAQQLALDAQDIPTLQREYFAGDVVDSTLTAYLQARRAEGHTIALLSNEVRSLREKLDAHALTPLFDIIVISAEIGVMKPDPAAYHAVLKALGRPAHETVFIDDMPANIDAANALGIQGVLYRAEMDIAATLAPLLTMP